MELTTFEITDGDHVLPGLNMPDGAHEGRLLVKTSVLTLLYLPPNATRVIDKESFRLPLLL